jgi:hypothetical protein
MLSKKDTNGSKGGERVGECNKSGAWHEDSVHRYCTGSAGLRPFSLIGAKAPSSGKVHGNSLFHEECATVTIFSDSSSTSSASSICTSQAHIA